MVRIECDVGYGTCRQSGHGGNPLGSVSAGLWYAVDVSSVITGDGIYGLRIVSSAANGADYVSSEGERIAPTDAHPAACSPLAAPEALGQPGAAPQWQAGVPVGLSRPTGR